MAPEVISALDGGTPYGFAADSTVPPHTALAVSP